MKIIMIKITVILIAKLVKKWSMLLLGMDYLCVTTLLVYNYHYGFYKSLLIPNIVLILCSGVFSGKPENEQQFYITLHLYIFEFTDSF